MNIIIVGCGQVGETLAAELGAEGNDITIVDPVAEKVNAIASRLDVMGVVGNGATHTTLREAGIEKADLLIAVTGSDELNILCCLIAKRHGRCNVIARIQNPVYNSESSYLQNELGLAMVINPEYAAAEEIARVLRFPAANKIETFAKGRVELLKCRLPQDSMLVGMSVRNVISATKSDVLICTCERENEAYIVNGDFVFEKNDLISVIATPKNAYTFLKKIGIKGGSVGDALILGSGPITYYLCDILRKSGISLKVIDKNPKRCEELASLHREVTVILADETDQELLVEEGIEKADAILSLTESDDENILLSLSAKNYGEGKIITKIDKPEYDDIIRRLEFDTAIYPKIITSDMIARYVRAMQNTLDSAMETMYTFIKDKVEASEFIIKDGSPVVNIPLSELGKVLKKDVLVAAILRGDKVIIPHGQDMILPGDAVVIVSKLLGFDDISDIIG